VTFLRPFNVPFLNYGERPFLPFPPLEATQPESQRRKAQEYRLIQVRDRMLRDGRVDCLEAYDVIALSAPVNHVAQQLTDVGRPIENISPREPAASPA
jgi:hypothetical protein